VRLRWTLSSIAIALYVGLSSAMAVTRCEILKYVFQDQDGNEAVVKNIKECFGWFNRDIEELSSKKDDCFTEQEAENHIRPQRKKYDTRIVGTRIFTVLYKSRFINISESAVFGSPWLSYEVNPDLRMVNIAAFKTSDKLYQFLDGGEVKFDFTKDAPNGFDTPENLYKGLLGTQFIFKRCQP